MGKRLTELTNDSKVFLLSRTPYVLPDNPSSKGFSAHEIKKSMYGGFVVIYEWLKKTIEETNNGFNICENSIDSLSISLTKWIDSIDSRLDGTTESLLKYDTHSINGKKFTTTSGITIYGTNIALNDTYGSNTITAAIDEANVSIEGNKSSISSAFDRITKLEDSYNSAVVTTNNMASKITKVGTITEGAWNGTAIADAYISSASKWNDAVADLSSLKTTISENRNILQSQIDAINASQNFVATYATHADMANASTSSLDDKDCVLVLKDETHDGQAYVYRWNGSKFTEVGSLGDCYTRAQIDEAHTVIENEIASKVEALNTKISTVDSKLVGLFTATSSSTEVSE